MQTNWPVKSYPNSHVVLVGWMDLFSEISVKESILKRQDDVALNLGSDFSWYILHVRTRTPYFKEHRTRHSRWEWRYFFLYSWEINPTNCIASAWMVPLAIPLACNNEGIHYMTCPCSMLLKEHSQLQDVKSLEWENEGERPLSTTAHDHWWISWIMLELNCWASSISIIDTSQNVELHRTQFSCTPFAFFNWMHHLLISTQAYVSLFRVDLLLSYCLLPLLKIWPFTKRCSSNTKCVYCTSSKSQWKKPVDTRWFWQQIVILIFEKLVKASFLKNVGDCFRKLLPMLGAFSESPNEPKYQVLFRCEAVFYIYFHWWDDLARTLHCVTDVFVTYHVPSLKRYCQTLALFLNSNSFTTNPVLLTCLSNRNSLPDFIISVRSLWRLL